MPFVDQEYNHCCLPFRTPLFSRYSFPFLGGLKQDHSKSSTINYEPTSQSQPQQQSISSSSTNPLSLDNVDAATANLLNLMQWVTNANATFAAAVASVNQNPPSGSQLSPVPLSLLSQAPKPPTSADEASAVALDAAETAALLDPIAASGGAPAPILYANQCSGGNGGTNNGQSGAFTAGSSGGSYGQGQQQSVSSSSAASLAGGGGWGGGHPPPMLPPNAPPGGSLQVYPSRFEFVCPPLLPVMTVADSKLIIRQRRALGHYFLLY